MIIRNPLRGSIERGMVIFVLANGLDKTEHLEWDKH